MRRRLRPPSKNLRDAWRANPVSWIAWARAPMHDSYWRFHRDQFLSLLPAPGALTIDVGAGEGRLAVICAGRGHKVIALDLSQPLAVAARQADASMGILWPTPRRCRWQTRSPT